MVCFGREGPHRACNGDMVFEHTQMLPRSTCSGRGTCTVSILLALAFGKCVGSAWVCLSARTPFESNVKIQADGENVRLRAKVKYSALDPH